MSKKKKKITCFLLLDTIKLTIFLYTGSGIKKTIVRMVCSICNQGGHNASSCNSDAVKQSIARIKVLLVG